MQDIIDGYNTKLFDLMIESNGVTVNKGFYEYPGHELNYDAWVYRIAITTIARQIVVLRDSVVDKGESLLRQKIIEACTSLLDEIKSHLNNNLMLIVRKRFTLDMYYNMATRAYCFNVICRVAVAPKDQKDLQTFSPLPFKYSKGEGEIIKE